VRVVSSVYGVKAAYGHEECANSLIHHGAAVNAHDVRGRTPLHMAAMCGHVALLGMLIQVRVLAVIQLSFVLQRLRQHEGLL